MAPIRVGIIGLSSRTGAHEAGGWCGTAHIPYLRSSSQYEIVAITGRTHESAKKAIVVHQLAETTKIYLSAEEIAADPDVDLVVVSMRVENHLANALPAIKAGKDIFVEWPFFASTAEAEEMSKLVIEKGTRSFVGLEARADPIVHRVKNIIDSGAIGRVTCSLLSASSGMLPATVWAEGVEYYLSMASGGNDYHTYFGHFIDMFTFVLGDFATVQGTLVNQTPITAIYKADGTLVNASHPRTSPDEILVQGTLSNGAAASITQRKPPVSVDDLGLRWLITGTEGEIEVTCPLEHFSTAPPGRKLRVKTRAKGGEEVEVHHPAEVMNPDWNHNVHNVALMYEAFAKNDPTGFASFQSALTIRKLMDKVVSSSGFKY